MTPLQRIDHNFWLHASRVPELQTGMKVVHLAHMSYVDGQVDCDTYNVLHIRNGRLLTHSELEESLAHFHSKHVDCCLWVNSDNLTDRVSRMLAHHGMMPQGEEIAMSLDLATYTPVPSGREQHILTVRTAEQLRHFSRIIAANWSPPDREVEAYYAATASHYLNPDLGITLLMYVNESGPQATVELFPSDADTVGIYSLATLEGARGRGIGSALMTHALTLAKARGYREVVLQASPDGLGIYRKLGFQEHGTFVEYG